MDRHNESFLRNESDHIITHHNLKHKQFPCRFKFVHIPTLHTISPFEQTLKRFCSPLINSKWAPLYGYEKENYWVLQITMSPIIKNIQLKPFKPPTITITFPSFVTMENMVELEERRADRHLCMLLPCSEFCLCPATGESPIASDHHFHCMTLYCPRFFDKLAPPARPGPQ